MRTCAWCPNTMEGARLGQRFCQQRCRQAAHRLTKRGPGAMAASATGPLRFRYYDPPYPGTAAKYYKNEPTYAGEVDHVAMIADAEAARVAGVIGGYAISTAASSLQDVLAMCPRGTRTCPWVKPIGVPPTSYGTHNTWEPLLVVGGRRLRGGCRDWLKAMPARLGGVLPGRKPLAFCAFLFQQLGMLPGDELEDRFPGTGIITTAWREAGRVTAAGTTAPRSPATGDAA